MSAVTIRKVDNPQDYRLFYEFPWKHYKNDPNWVPPLLSQRRDLLDKKRNPAWDYMEGDYFIAVKDGEVVGTIVGFINHRHNEHNHEHIGWFGLYETINDLEVSNALLNAAAEYVKSRGFSAMRGPQSFTTHEECGLLVDNFSAPQVLMPYNPPYYAQLIESAGYEKAMDVYSVYQDRDIVNRNNTVERFGKIAMRAQEKSGIVIRPLNVKRKKEEFAVFKNIYNEAWNDNWSFVPFTPRELDALVESLGMFVDPRLAFFAQTPDGTPIGFALGIPNLNESLAFAYPRPGVPEIWTLLKVLYHWQIAKRIRSVRLPLMGVIPEHRNKGVEVALMHAILREMLPLPYHYLDAGWILESNQLMSIVGKVEGKPYKTHRFYEKKF